MIESKDFEKEFDQMVGSEGIVKRTKIELPFFIEFWHPPEKFSNALSIQSSLIQGKNALAIFLTLADKFSSNYSFSLQITLTQDLGIWKKGSSIRQIVRENNTFSSAVRMKRESDKDPVFTASVDFKHHYQTRIIQNNFLFES